MCTRLFLPAILTFVDVLPVDLDVLVTVAACVFVVETQSVQQLVLDDAMVDAAKPLQWNHLFVSGVTQQRSTAKEEQKKQEGATLNTLH